MIGWILAGLIAFLVILILLIRTPWAQEKITNEATRYISDKTGTEFSIGRLFITFSGNIQIEDLYAADQKGDTLVYSRSLEAGLGFRALFKGDIAVTKLDWQGLTARVSRLGENPEFNFQFIIDVFAGDGPEKSEPEEEPSEMPKITIGRIQLQDFDLMYLDDVTGIYADLIFDHFRLRPGKLDFEAFDFHIKSFEWVGLHASVRQTSSLTASEDEEETSNPLSSIRVDQFSLKDWDLDYKNVPDSLDIKWALDVFGLDELLADFQPTSPLAMKFDLKALHLDGSKIKYVNLAKPKGDEQSDTDSEFSWPELEIRVGKLDVSDNSIALISSSEPPEPGRFDPAHLIVDSLDFNFSELAYAPGTLRATLAGLNARERSGLKLMNTGFELEVGDQFIELQSLMLVTSASSLKADLSLQFEAFPDLWKRYEIIALDLKIHPSSIDLSDMNWFNETMEENSILVALSRKVFSLNLEATGSLEDIDLATLSLGWGGDTKIAGGARLLNIIDPNRSRIIAPGILVQTTGNDLNRILGGEQPILPDWIDARISYNGTYQDFAVSSILRVPEGKMDLSANVSTILDTLHYDGVLKTQNFDLGSLVEADALGSVSVVFDFKGQGTTLDEMVIDSRLESTLLEFRGYDYSGLNLTAQVNAREVSLKAGMDSTDLIFDLAALAILDTLNPTYALSLHIDGADLQALGWTTEAVRLRTDVDANFRGDPDNFSSSLTVANATIIKNQDAYPVKRLNLTASAGPGHTHLDLESEIMAARLRSTNKPEHLYESLYNHFVSYFREDQLLTAHEQVDMDLSIDLYSTDLLSDVILPDLEEMEPGEIRISYKEGEKMLSAEVDLPWIKYAGNSIRGISITAGSSRDTLAFNLGFEALEAGPIHIWNTDLNGRFVDGTLNLVLDIKDQDDEEFVWFSSSALAQGDTMQISLGHEKLILNGESWQLMPTNEIRVATDFLKVEDFVLSRRAERITLSSGSGEIADILEVDFKQFKLETFASLLNPEEDVLSGTLNGNLTVNSLFEEPLIDASLEIEQLTVMEAEIGKITLNASHPKDDLFNFSVTAGGGPLEMSLNGFFNTAGSEPVIQADLDIKQLQIQLLEHFLDDKIKESKGYLSAQVQVSGNTQIPDYTGDLKFIGAGFRIPYINASYTLSENPVIVDNKGVAFNQFSLIDNSGNKATLQGRIITNKLLNPDFDLTLIANNFQLLNSGKNDNDLFYGTMYCNANIKIGGNLFLPKLDVKARLNKGTEITFIVPESQVDIVDREGVVVYANVKDPDHPFTQQPSEVDPDRITGIDLKAIFEVDPQSTFRIIIDERSGDYLEFAGAANLSFDLLPSGMMSLSGEYKLSSGAYEMTFYQVTRRKFTLVPGGTITWSGDPLDASMDLKAMYSVRTAPLDLMSAQLTGSDASVRNRYRQELPFQVYLQIKGEILRPSISFELDMPEDHKGALGGNIYTRLQHINQNESELNKQVLALLIFNRFFPEETGGTGVNTGAMARNSVSQMLSTQLNQLSSKYIKGVELDLDLDSYRDYQSGTGQDRTQLNVQVRKSLMDDRLILQVGSQVGIEGEQGPAEQGGNEIIGNVSLEYLLTEDGRFRLRGFRKNEFEGMLEGQIIVTGISFILNKEFNKLKEIWTKEEEEEEEKEPTETDE